MEKYYIAGCGGMLGDAMRAVFLDSKLRCSDINPNDDWLTHLDFRDREQYTRHVCSFEPDALLHIGAHTDLEYCETNREDAWATNATSVETAVDIANMLGIPIVYISTAGVFDGAKDYYDDWDVPNPIGVYAQTKYFGERFVADNAKRYLVCRAGWMMGGGQRKDKKFVNKIIKQIVQKRQEIFVVNDKFGAPTYTLDFALRVKSLLLGEKWGLYNMAGVGDASRLCVANEILKIMGLAGTTRIVGVKSAHFQDHYFAPRPESERLINRKLEALGLQMRDWRLALREYLILQYSEHFNSKSPPE